MLLRFFYLLAALLASTTYANLNHTTDTNAITPEVKAYIDQAWDNLTRSNDKVYLANIDSKMPAKKTIIYVSRKEDINKVKNEFKHTLRKEAYNNIKILYLPRNLKNIFHHGLLYLPHPYVVPGGRFNEMYGWDSYFIELGLIQSNRLQLAKDMVENSIYEINYYGTILNANRTYYLERSQPPLLTQMILAYYEKTQDKQWLQSTLPAIDKLYAYWMAKPHYIPEIGLSRYYAGGEGPAPEESLSYYIKAANYFKLKPVTEYDKNLYYDSKQNRLTALFYKADRTVRESGFDITAKYGPFGASILDYASVDLNVLLYKMEADAAMIYQILHQPKLASVWQQRAEQRAKLINKYMWNANLGYYFDYNIRTKSSRPYVYATTFYPLWAGIASKEQAEQIVKNLPTLLAAGGIVTSTYQKQLQWDAPFGWAPLQYFTVMGLKKYHYNKEADDVATRFIHSVNHAFSQTHQIFEKYDVLNLNIYTANKIHYGYNTNEIGFGWTNGVYLSLLNILEDAKIAKATTNTFIK